MRAWMLAALLVATSIAGCADAPAQTDDEVQTPPPPAVPEHAAVYGGNVSAVLEGARNITGEAQYFLSGFNGAEPNMGVTSSGAIFASAGSTIIRSTDDGNTWEAVHTHQLVNSDPMMWVDPWTDCIYNVPMSVTLLAATIYESCDDGDSWSTIKGHNQGRGVYDHQKFASALPGPDAPPAAGLAHPTVMIICYNAIQWTACTVSYDGGATWPHDVPIWNAPQGPPCNGQQSHPTGAPDGTIVVAKAWGCAEPLVFISTDSGVTWEMRDGPQGVGADTLDPEIAFSDDGAMYMLWQSQRDESRAHLARSDDMGLTWEGPWDITPPGMNSTIFASLHAGSPGRVAAAFHATNHTGAPGAVPDDAIWHTYVVTTQDGDTSDPTFVSRRVQDDPIQVGSICKGNRGCHDGNRNLLDFIDGAVGPDGTFYTIIADACTGSCADGSDQTMQNSRGREVALVRLDGWSLSS